MGDAEYSYIYNPPGTFRLGRTDYSVTQRRRATIFRPATAAAHLTYDRHISERQSLNAIFTRVNPSIRINCIQRAVVRHRPPDLSGVHAADGPGAAQQQGHAQSGHQGQ